MDVLVPLAGIIERLMVSLPGYRFPARQHGTQQDYTAMSW